MADVHLPAARRERIASTLGALRRHPVAGPSVCGDDPVLEAARARAIATDIGQAVIDLRHISEDLHLSWQSVDETAERLTTAARAIRFCAYRAAGLADAEGAPGPR